MERRTCSRWMGVLAGFGLALGPVTNACAAGPSTAAVAGFNAYVANVEARLASEHGSPVSMVKPEEMSRLRCGDPLIEDLTPSGGESLPGALLHDWRGTTFVPGATAADFERVMQNFGAYPRYYAPQVVSTRIVDRQGEHFQVLMRVRQKHVITVVMDTTYDVAFAQTGPERGYSISRSTNIDEIASSGTRDEHALSPDAGHGFLWRLNTYWNYEQQDGGLFIRIESVSLTRSIPAGLGWAIGPFIQRVPRDSLEFTLQATCKALRPVQARGL